MSSSLPFFSLLLQWLAPFARTGEVLRSLRAALDTDFSGVAPQTYVLPDFEAVLQRGKVMRLDRPC